MDNFNFRFPSYQDHREFFALIIREFLQDEIQRMGGRKIVGGCYGIPQPTISEALASMKIERMLKLAWKMRITPERIFQYMSGGIDE